jgi:hypothetical protein
LRAILVLSGFENPLGIPFNEGAFWFEKVMHDYCMRTTVTLDDDVHELAMIYARARGIPLGAAIGELIRNGRLAKGADFSSIIMGSHGIPVFRSRGRVITSEMVREAQEDDRE